MTEQDIKLAEAKKRMAARASALRGRLNETAAARRSRLKARRCGCNRPAEVWLTDETPLCATCFGYSRRQAEILLDEAVKIAGYKTA